MGDKPKTQDVPKVGMGDEPKTKEVPKVGMGDKPKTKEVPKVGMGDKPQISEVPNVGMGDKQKRNKVPKVGVGEAQMVPMEEPPQRNFKFEQDRKRCITDTDGKNPHENKSVHRDTCVSDLVWPNVKLIIQNTLNDLTSKFSRQWPFFIKEWLGLWHEFNLLKYKDIILVL